MLNSVLLGRKKVIQIDEKSGSIFYVTFNGPKQMDDIETYLSRFDEWLSQDKTFSLILNQIDAEAAEANRAEGSQKREAEWLRQNKPRIAQRCAWIAMVLDSAILVEKWQPIAPKAIENMFGCSGRVFSSVSDAEQWIEKQMSLAS